MYDLSAIASLLMSIILQYAPPFLLSLFSALLFHYLIERWKRPDIDILEDQDEYNPQFKQHFLHVRVVNKQGKRINKNAAIDAESEVYIMDAKTRRLKEGSPFSTKWARLTTAVAAAKNDQFYITYFPLNPPAERRINIYPGQMDGGKEGLQLDVILKNKGESCCWIHDPQLYHARADEREKWRLEKGTYYLMIRIRYAGGVSKPKFFILENESEDPSKVKLKECPRQKLKELKKLFKQYIS